MINDPSRIEGASLQGNYLDLRHVPWRIGLVAFMLYFAAITTYAADIGTVSMAVAVGALFLGPKKIRWPPAFWLLLLFWLWAGLSSLISTYPGDLEPVVELGKLLLIFTVAINVLDHPSTLRAFLAFYLACFTLFPVRGTLFNYFIYDSADFGRPSWVRLFGNPNDMAALTILSLALAAGFLHRELPKKIRVSALGLCMVFAFIVLLTQSRAGFIGMAVFVALYMSTSSGKRFRTLLVTCAVAAIVVTLAPSDVWQRVAGLKHAADAGSIAEMDPEGSAAERWEIAQTGLKIAGDNLLVGVGLGRSGIAHAFYSPKLGRKSLHNTFLEVMVETGAVGLCLFGLFIASVLGVSIRSRARSKAMRSSHEWRRLQLLEFGLLGYFVSGLWGTYAFLALLYVYAALILVQAETLFQQSKVFPMPRSPTG